jgi:hypothetical protein
VVRLEIRGIFVGAILSVVGLIVFLYGTAEMNQANAVSNSFLIVVGVFLGMAGFFVLATSIFSRGSIFH